MRMAHTPSGDETDFPVLHMHLCVGESVHRARMIVMKGGDDEVCHVLRGDPDSPQCLHWVDGQRTGPLCRRLLAKTGIDQNGKFSSARNPHIEVDWHRPVMHIANDEMVMDASLLEPCER